MSIPVICDRCRQAGIAGDADFSHLGDLLDFTPVPRKTKRSDGWTPERQRAFIAALSVTGSKRQAALAIGKHAFGVDQLLKSEGSDSFKAAVERALALAAQHGSMKLAQGIADAAARNAQLTPPSRLRGLPAPAENGFDDRFGDAYDYSEEERLQLLQGLAGKFMKKVAAEREARLAGEIVAADFYLRQVTALEVMFDLASRELGFDPGDLLRELHRGGHPLVAIAATSFSDLLDQSRREWWAKSGGPERPPHPDTRFLDWRPAKDGAFAVAREMYPAACAAPPPGVGEEDWQRMTKAERQSVIDRIRAELAAEQRAYEQRAFEEWRGE